MKSLLLILLNLLSSMALADCPSIDFPSEIVMKEKIISIGTQFNLESNGNKIGNIEEAVMSLSTDFTLTNAKGEKVALAKKRIISWGTIIDVYDCKNQKIGIVEENIVESFFSVKSHYSIKDQNNQLVAKSEMISFFKTNIDIKAKGQDVLTMKRDMINLLSDTWRVKLLKSNVNPLLLIMIPAFKTNSDNEREAKKKKSSSNKNK